MLKGNGRCGHKCCSGNCVLREFQEGRHVEVDSCNSQGSPGLLLVLTSNTLHPVPPSFQFSR